VALVVLVVAPVATACLNSLCQEQKAIYCNTN